MAISASTQTPTSPQQESSERKYEKLNIIRRKLDKEIGYNYWKKYVASAFWSQISTPINLTITFLTAITTAQAQTESLLPATLYSQIAIISLVITTLNTFFRPHTQYAANTEYLAKWKELGIKFEKEYFNRMEAETVETYDSKIDAYMKLQDEVDTLRKSEGTEMVNFLTDFIYILVYHTCLRKYKRWLDSDRRIIVQAKSEIRLQIQEKKEKDNEAKLEEEQIKARYEIQLARLKQQTTKTLENIGGHVGADGRIEIVIGENIPNEDTVESAAIKEEAISQSD
jgi:hypothetical protein